MATLNAFKAEQFAIADKAIVCSKNEVPYVHVAPVYVSAASVYIVARARASVAAVSLAAASTRF